MVVLIRNGIAVAAGALVAFATFMVGMTTAVNRDVQGIAHPRSASFGDRPATLFLAILAALAIGALLGGWLAARIAHAGASLALAGLLIACNVTGGMTGFSPAWFWVGTMVIPIPFALAGARLANRNTRHRSPS